MGAKQLSMPHALVLALRDAGNYKALVETGTWKGSGCTWAAQHFETVYTIEGHEPRYEKTKAAYAGQYPNLNFILGDSRHWLNRVLANRVGEPCILFLDAHWCFGGAREAHELGDECPLREELQTVNALPQSADYAILIDDARLFLEPPKEPHNPLEWPTIDEVYALLNEHPRYTTIIDDVIVSVPLRLQPTVESAIAVGVW